VRDPDLFLAETKANALLLKYCIEEPRFNIEALARVIGLDVIYGGLENVDAWLLRRDDGSGVIRVSDTITNPNRRRFSIAHEIGHWIMHKERGQGYLCTAKDLSDYVNSPEEIEANWFAATLLMPKNLVNDAIKGKDPSFATIEKITRNFETSRIAAARRFVELTRERVILVYSKSGQIIWRTKSKAAQYDALVSKTIPDESWTFKVNNGEIAPNGHQPCIPDVWLKENPYRSISELFEDVRVVDSLAATMTLLWLT